MRCRGLTRHSLAVCIKDTQYHETIAIQCAL